jgi:hypothetical protein
MGLLPAAENSSRITLMPVKPVSPDILAVLGTVDLELNAVEEQ